MDLSYRQKALNVQKMTFSFSAILHQEIQILESPSDALLQIVEKEAEINPFLFLEKGSVFSQHTPINIPQPQLQFHEHILRQIEERFPKGKIRQDAITLLAELNETGFLPKEYLQMHPEHNDLQKELLFFDPIGVFATSLQECLLAQLEAKKKTNTLSYLLIKEYFSQVLCQQFSSIEKKISFSIQEMHLDLYRHVKPLYTNPRGLFQKDVVSIAQKAPEIVVDEMGSIAVDPFFPKLYRNAPCLITQNSKGYKTYLLFEKKAYLLEKQLDKRRFTLRKLTALIYQHQKGFFLQNEPLKPLSIKQAASALSIPEMQLRRTAAKKTLSFEGRLFSLLSFFSKECSGYSRDFIENAIKQSIQNEPDTQPLSDQQLAIKLAEKGCYISRRTVAKYRKRMGFYKKALRKTDFTEIE